MVMAGLQVRVRAAAKAVNVVRVRLLSHAEKAKRQLPSKAAATSTMMKAVSRTSIVKRQTVKPLLPVGRIVQEETVHMAEAEIAGAVAVAGIVVEVLAADAARVAEAIVVLVAVVEIAATARKVKHH
jgi:hypothetical protein